MVKYGVWLPNFGACCSSPRLLAELAYEAEKFEWDGFFLWDHLHWHDNGEQVPVADPWIALSAAAMRTEEIRLGTMVTPLARRRPWKVARETVSLDHLSGGRLTLGVGLGEPRETEFSNFGEVANGKTAGEMLDEALDVLSGLWTGQPFSYQGKHYRVSETVFLPTPLQKPRIPIWVANIFPNKRPLLRAVRWNGIIPGQPRELTPTEVKNTISYVMRHRTEEGPFDNAFLGRKDEPGPNGAKGSDKVSLYAEAGVTWWLERMFPWRDSFREVQSQIQQGPPS